MSDTLITVIAIVVVAGLIFVVPLVTMADRFDTTAQAEVEAIVADFVDEIRSTGKITQAKYDKFLQNLDSQGYVFGVEMEVKNIDENPGKKSIQTERDKIGENVYYSEYTTQILADLESRGFKDLEQGSIVVVTVRNEDLTFGQQMKQFMYRIVGNDTASIVASKAGMVQ